MSNTDLDKREKSGINDFSGIIDANYNDDERKRLNQIAKDDEKSKLDKQSVDKDKEAVSKDKTIPYRNENKRFGGKGNKSSLGKKMLLGGGIGGGIVALIVSAFISFLPLKIVHIFANLQSHFFGTSESAVTNRTERMLSDYLRKKVAPGLSGDPSSPCHRTGTISRNCVNTSDSRTIAGRLYNTWRDAKLEHKLASRYGIELKRVNSSGVPHFELTVGGNNSGVDVDGWLNSTSNNQTLWTAIGDRQDVRRSFRESLKHETWYRRVMYRYKVGRLLERKYGIKRCVFACKTRDNFAEWGDRKKSAAQLMLIRRVIIPHTDHLGLALECIFTNTCGVGDNDDMTPDGEDNQRRDLLEKKIAKELEKKAIEFAADDVAKIARLADEILKLQNAGGFSNYLMQKLISKLGSEFLTKYGVPIIGWIDAVATVVNAVHDAGPKIKRWTFVIGATAMVSYYMLQASHASEIKSGNTQHDLAGSMVSAFGNTAGKPGHQNQSAENSPLYTAVMGNRGQPPARSIISTFLPSALAAAPDNPDLAKNPYNCDDGHTLDPQKLICPEESLVSQNILVTASAILDQAPWNILVGFAQTWRAAFGPIKSAINAVMNNVFGWTVGAIEAAVSFVYSDYDNMKAAIGSRLNDLIMIIAQWFIPSPISENMSGARAFNMAAGGADAAGADFAHYGLGAKRVTDQVAAQIREENANEALLDFQSRPLFARMFDSDDSHSFVSQVAMSMPLGTTSYAQSSFASIISSPFTKLFNGFASLMPGQKRVKAAPINDPFGIPQYAYDLNDPEVKAAMGMDPEAPELTDAACAQTNKDWAAGEGVFAGTLKIDDDTGMDYHTKLNPCLLNNAAAASGGGYFSTDVLSQADLGDAESFNAPSNPQVDLGGVGSANGFTFPLKTTKSTLINNSPRWCHDNQSNCHHDYNAADIFAPTGTLVVAPASGTVVRVAWSTTGRGYRVTIKADAPDGRLYFHNHMWGDPGIPAEAPHSPPIEFGIVLGMHVTAGQPIGRVGTVAEAEGTPQHLHIDVLPSSYSSHPDCPCTNADGYINIQPALIDAFNTLPN